MPLISLICSICEETFELERWDIRSRLKKRKARGNEDESLFCSKSCASIASNTNRYEKRLLKCANCGKEEIVNESHFRKKYCSHPCYRVHQHQRLALLARRIGKQFAEQIGASQRESYATGRRVHGRLGKVLNEESKSLISAARLKYHETNPGYWKGKKMPASAREKMSRSRSKLILSGGFLWKGSHLFSKKNNVEIHCRSTWERRYFLFLESRIDVLSYQVEPFAIPYQYNGNRLYHPDVLINYADGHSELHEIKPAYYVTYPVNLAKFDAAEKHCAALKIPFRVITEVEMVHIL